MRSPLSWQEKTSHFPHRPASSPRRIAPWSVHIAPCPVVRSRCGRARCPHRAANPRTARTPWSYPSPVPHALALLGRRDGRPWRLATRALPPLPPRNSPAPHARAASPVVPLDGVRGAPRSMSPHSPRAPSPCAPHRPVGAPHRRAIVQARILW